MAQEFSTHIACGEPFSFTTEPLPQTDYPWQEGFESGGNLPALWIEALASGSTHWAFQAGGVNGTPSAAARGQYNAVFEVRETGRKRS